MKELMDSNMIVVIVAACIIVLFAMIIDLISGLSKAKQRGEFRSSWGLKRSLNKFILYEGGLLIGGCIDVLVYLCNLTDLLGLDSLHGIPFITCLIGVFLCFVELLSVREKADKKTKTEFVRVQKLAEGMVTKEELIESLTEAIKKARNEKE